MKNTYEISKHSKTFNIRDVQDIRHKVEVMDRYVDYKTFTIFSLLNTSTAEKKNPMYIPVVSLIDIFKELMNNKTLMT